MATLYKNCPKCSAASAGLDVCAACGLIFAKYLRAKIAPPEVRVRRAVEQTDDDSRFAQLKEALFYVPDQVDPVFVYGRAVLLGAIAFYGAKLAMIDHWLGRVLDAIDAQGMADDLWREKEAGTLRRAASLPHTLAAFIGGKLVAGAVIMTAVGVVVLGVLVGQGIGTVGRAPAALAWAPR